MINEPIRVLHIVGIMNRGGIETFLMNIYRKVDRSKIQFDFLVTREEVGVFDEEICSLGGEIYNIPYIKKVGLAKYKRIVNDFFKKNNHYRIVHCHMNTWSGLFLPIAKINGIPIRIAHSHTAGKNVKFRDYVNYIFKKYNSLFIKKNATHLFACGQKASEYLFGKSYSKNSVKVINNAIDTEKYKYDINIASRIRKTLNISESTFVVGHVGSFSYPKNHDYLIDIFKNIKVQQPNSVLLLVGEGELKEQIKLKAEKLGLISNIRFLGVRDDVNELMMAFDVFLFPSLFEGFPVTLVEAQASGLNCVVSNTISNEVDMGIGIVTFLDLNESPEQWADVVLNRNGSNRNISITKLIELGFDSKTTANWLQNFYTESNG